MEGSVQGRRLALEVQRDFAGSRLEEQILIRVFELVTPAVRRAPGENKESASTRLSKPVHSILAKGA